MCTNALRPTRSLLAALLAALSVTLLLAGPASAAPPPVPDTPAPVLDIVSARPFTLGRAERHQWRADRPEYRTGYLLVLRVQPEFVYPRQVAEPVLYVGGQTAERVNVGYQSGYVVAVVPGVTDPTRADHLDLARATIFFGTPAMPERVDAKGIAAERDAARRAGIRPLPAARVAAAREAGGEPLVVATKTELVRAAAELVLRHSPQERDLALGILAPEQVGRPDVRPAP